jgi:serine/threonine protein kinase/WD40 repeat protein
MKTINVIEAVFFAALEKKEPGERAAYLDKACSGDPDLRRCVEKLLAAQPNVGEFLQAPAAGLPAAAKAAEVDRGADERPGTILGPYKLLHEIGEGGMGTVWMAEQTQPVKRRVALKVIKPGMSSRQVLARFEAERQALALMDHPNIAKVLDAGATDGGRPYFVMELVKGQPVTEFCDRNRLTTSERLELFVAVCHAIQHAHHKGVIHRDIKPTNVLVALYDGKPVPKVIDFGVAKAVAEPLTDKTLFTRHGQVVGTFEYMSPEQANLDQLDIDTRSDVYALGVLLYELLTGTTPLDKDRLRQAGFAEMLRLIREEEPPRPSTRLTSTPGLLATAAAYRKTDSQRLPRAVRGELDWIVMKALDKDRNRRFATANGLAADVERFLKGEPVQACPPTVGYRFQKYARKHKVALAAGAAIAVALLVGLALTSWQAVRATNAERGTAAERDRAVKLGEELDAKLGEIRAANDERRVSQYVWDLQSIPALWEAGSTGEARRALERQPSDLRGFEWRYWDRKMHSEAASFPLPDVEDPGPARRNAIREQDWRFSDDGSRVVRATSSPRGFRPQRSLERIPGTLKVWDVATRKVLLSHTLAEDENGGGIENYALSHDGKIVLMGGTIVAKDQATPFDPRFSDSNGWVRVLEVESGKELFNSRKVMSEGQFSRRAHLSRDGRKLVTHETSKPGAEPRFSRYKVWDLGAAEKQPLVIGARFIFGFNPDGSRLLGDAVEDGKTRRKLWDTATGQEIPGFSLSTDQQFRDSDVFGPDGALLARVTAVPAGKEGSPRVAQSKYTLRVLDATNTSKEIFSFDLGTAPSSARVVLPVFTNDGSRVAKLRNVPGSLTNAGLTNAGPRVEWLVFDAKSGNLVTSFDDPGYESITNAGPRGVASSLRAFRMFSDDGSQFICAIDNTVYTFDSTTGLPVHTLRGSETPIAHMVALPNGRLRTVETSGTIREWDLRPVEPVRTAVVEQPRGNGTFRGRFGPNQTVVSADGAWLAGYIAASDEDGTAESVRVLDAAGKASIPLTLPQRQSGPRTRMRIAQISADGKRVALVRAGFSFARNEPKKEKGDPAPPPPPDVTVWDVASRKMLFHRDLERPGNGLANNLVRLSPDGTTLALLEGTRGTDTVTSTLSLINVVTGRTGSKIEVAGNVAGFSFSPDGRRIAVGIPQRQFEWPMGARQVTVLDAGTGERIGTIEEATLAALNVLLRPITAESWVWTPDGSRLAFVEPGGSRIHFVDVTTGKLVKALAAAGRGGSIRSGRGQLAFSPDGRRMACLVEQRIGRHATVNVLDTDSGRVLLSLPNPNPNSFGDKLRFSPDGHRLIHFSSRLDSSSTPAVSKWHVRVTTWDATPRPEPKQP